MDYTEVTLTFDSWYEGAWLSLEVDGEPRECRFDAEERPDRVPCEPEGSVGFNWDEGTVRLWVGLPDTLHIRIRDEDAVRWETVLELEYERYTVCTTRCRRAEHHLRVQ
jgi:hypothetical protein